MEDEWPNRKQFLHHILQAAGHASGGDQVFTKKHVEEARKFHEAHIKEYAKKCPESLKEENDTMNELYGKVQDILEGKDYKKMKE